MRKYIPYCVMGLLVALVVLMPELSRRTRRDADLASPQVLRDTVRIRHVDTVTVRDTVRRTVYVPSLPSVPASHGGREYRLENDTISLRLVADSLRSLAYELRVPVHTVTVRDTLLVREHAAAVEVVRWRNPSAAVGVAVCWPLGPGISLSAWRGRWQIGGQYYPLAGAAAATLQWTF